MGAGLAAVLHRPKVFPREACRGVAAGSPRKTGPLGNSKFHSGFMSSNATRYTKAMPIRDFIRDESFDPETIEIMNKAFVGVCQDLGLSDTADGATAMVARRIIELADGQRDPEEIRAAVLASFKK